jgi:ATP-dependent Clp protease ATP-binding subunit ClpX
MDGVQLKFTDNAIQAIAGEAIKRNSGARGLRAILESAMLDVMYDVPQRGNAREVVVNDEVITKKTPPVIVYEQEAGEAAK